MFALLKKVFSFLNIFLLVQGIQKFKDSQYPEDELFQHNKNAKILKFEICTVKILKTFVLVPSLLYSAQQVFVQEDKRALETV